MKKISQLSWLWLAVFALPAVALAQQTIPANSDDAAQLAKQLWDFMVNKQWALAAGPGIALLVWLVRTYDIKLPKYGPQVDEFLNRPIVAFLLPTLVSALGGFFTAIAAHQPPVEAMKAVFQASMSAVFTYIGLKKVAEQQGAGAAAVAAVGDKPAAIEELKKP